MSKYILFRFEGLDDASQWDDQAICHQWHYFATKFLEDVKFGRQRALGANVEELRATLGLAKSLMPSYSQVPELSVEMREEWADLLSQENLRVSCIMQSGLKQLDIIARYNSERVSSVLAKGLDDPTLLTSSNIIKILDLDSNTRDRLKRACDKIWEASRDVQRQHIAALQELDRSRWEAFAGMSGFQTAARNRCGLW
ncbi:MAG: hypothetical protein R3C03_08760 [Pirellulaceae bacterium]